MERVCIILEFVWPGTIVPAMLASVGLLTTILAFYWRLYIRKLTTSIRFEPNVTLYTVTRFLTLRVGRNVRIVSTSIVFMIPTSGGNTKLFHPRMFETVSLTSFTLCFLILMSRAVPENVRETLISRYEYVVTEKEFLPDLTDDVRLCVGCSEWCPR